RPDPPPPAQRFDADGHQGPEPERTADHYLVLLRRIDDERDRCHARPERVAGLTDALIDHSEVTVPTGLPSSRVRDVSDRGHRDDAGAGPVPWVGMRSDRLSAG